MVTLRRLRRLAFGGLPMSEPGIVIFDGHCNLCNGTVDFLLKRDRAGQLRFTANQNEAGKRILAENAAGFAGGAPPDAIFLFEDGRLYASSTAALRIARRLPFPWKLAYAANVIPRSLRDPIYAWVARNRYRWFGKKETCRLPTPDERGRFLP
jgi:predicted DCC family thiol-disulfide oxidoreductase YuxK